MTMVHEFTTPLSWTRIDIVGQTHFFRFHHRSINAAGKCFSGQWHKRPYAKGVISIVIIQAAGFSTQWLTASLCARTCRWQSVSRVDFCSDVATCLLTAAL